MTMAGMIYDVSGKKSSKGPFGTIETVIMRHEQLTDNKLIAIHFVSFVYI